ncbi:carotenoid oxygenase family protein [Myxacorys almedinensis]|uniref:Apocarotenoid-15,15'-oxygenase n=1 Tax=Myxacorys almedinensis A TaxID=2690445 RepID=A0A8J7Z4N1_9CYAN|nr:carotenoid oxygenase family protein [Myxacorys almedinensis]NDJ18091.1 Apocarotenoid-15,15'-oxygenase [Myxacorys almedinensis A]
MQLFEHASTVPITSYNTEEWQKGYRSLHHEYEYWIDEVEGEIPLALQGTLFRNGPGLLDVKGQRLQHPFDGDGMICAIAFKDGRAHFRNRFVKTEGYLAEQEAGKILYRGVFGTQKPGGWLANAFDTRIKNIANTQVLYWGGKLLALWEAAEPHRLDPQTLETVGQEYFDGVLSPGAPFAAHPWIDPVSQFDQGAPCLVNFSIKAGLSFTIAIYELDVNGKIVRQHDHPVPGFAFIHDFAITPNYCIFFQNPVDFNPIPFLAGLKSAGECIKFRPDKPTRVILIPRDTASGRPQPIIFETQSGFVFHHANAYEQDGEIVLDSVCYENLPSVEPGSDYRQTDFEALMPGQLWRFHIKLSEQTIERNLLEQRCCEFPFVHPAVAGRRHRYIYMAAAHAPSGNAPHQAILKVDVETGVRQLASFAPDGYVSEPVFVPRSHSDASGLFTEVHGAEDEGWLLAIAYDGQRDRSSVVILDAQNLEQGAIARLHLKHHVPYGLHGSFTSECFAPEG